MIAMSAFSATFGLGIVFFVAFPALAHVLIGFAVAQGLSERHDNEQYAAGLSDES